MSFSRNTRRLTAFAGAVAVLSAAGCSETITDVMIAKDASGNVLGQSTNYRTARRDRRSRRDRRTVLERWRSPHRR